MHINYVNQCNEIPVWQYLRIGCVRGPRLIGIGIGLEIGYQFHIESNANICEFHFEDNPSMLWQMSQLR